MTQEPNETSAHRPVGVAVGRHSGQRIVDQQVARERRARAGIGRAEAIECIALVANWRRCSMMPLHAVELTASGPAGAAPARGVRREADGNPPCAPPRHRVPEAGYREGPA